MNSNITIALTSCGRYNLLKKTITSLSQSCDISKYHKIMSEDSKDKKHLEKIKQANKNGFLQGWKIIYTGGIGKTNEEKHYNALKKLYNQIKTEYVFHCEDDWYFKKVDFDFIKISENILNEHKNIGIIQLRNFKKDGGYNHININKNERKNELFENKKFQLGNNFFLKFRNDKNGDDCKGFSLNPGLRRTNEIKKIMFEDKTIKKVDEAFFGKKMYNMGLFSIKLIPGVCTHLGNSFFSTKILEKGFLNGLKTTLIGVYNYRIKTILINRTIKPLFFKLYKTLDLFYPTRYLMDILSYLKRKKSIPKITKEQLTNIEGIKEMNIPISWFTEKKPLGISGVARLKNGDGFLEKVIESHIPFLDEIILVDNMSTDKTKEICLKLQKKYPDKVKFFEYKYPVNAPGNHEKIVGNSIHSFAYFSNWCQSKSKYKYVMKIDDDNLFLQEKGKKIRKYILNKKPNKYVVYWGYNLMKNNEGKIGISKENPYIGRYGDHGIYPVSKYSYYKLIENDKNGYEELFINRLFIKRCGFGFYHLKYLKKNFGLTNVSGNYWGKYFYKMCKRGKLLSKNISQKILSIINK